MQEIIAYQKGKLFVLSRTSDKTDLDAEEFLRHLNQAREQLKSMEKGIEEFKRDIKKLEKLEQVAKSLRKQELEESKKQRDKLK